MQKVQYISAPFRCFSNCGGLSRLTGRYKWTGKNIFPASEGLATHSYYYLRSSRVQADKTSLRCSLTLHCSALTVRHWLYGTDCMALLVSRSSAHAQYCARTNTTSLHFEYKTVEATCTRCTESDERDLPDCFLKRVLFYPCLFRSLSQKKMFLPFFTHNEQIIQNCDVPYKSQQLDD